MKLGEEIKAMYLFSLPNCNFILIADLFIEEIL